MYIYYRMTNTFYRFIELFYWFNIDERTNEYNIAYWLDLIIQTPDIQVD